VAQIEYASAVCNFIRSTDSYKHKRVKRKFSTLYDSKFFVGLSVNNYEGILATLNISKLNTMWRNLNAMFLINASKNKISCSSILDTVCLCTILARIIRVYSTCIVHRHLKVSPWARCVSAVDSISKNTGIFNKKIFFVFWYIIILLIFKLSSILSFIHII
jgi:hypothetical protein